MPPHLVFVYKAFCVVVCQSPGDDYGDSVVTFYLVKKRVDADKVAVRHWSDRSGSELLDT